MKMKRRSFIKGLIGAISAPKVLKAGDSDISVLKAKEVPLEKKAVAVNTGQELQDKCSAGRYYCSTGDCMGPSDFIGGEGKKT